MLNLDMGAIALGISGMTASSCYFGFYCFPDLQMLYVSVSLFFGVLLWIIIVLPKLFPYPIRLGFFILFAVFGAVPLFHWTYILGFDALIVKRFFWRILMTYVLLGIGFAVWRLRIPERWLIGKVDIWFSSHQLWHIFVMLGPGFLLRTSIHFLEFSRENPCNPI